MSRVGLDWYKREPVAYLGDVQGLSSKEHAVYSVVIDLLYVHGGTIRNDPKFIAGYISDMGTAAIRNALDNLDANERISITITNDEISQKRAKNEVKTKQKQNENARETGKKGGILSAKLRAEAKENNDLAQGYPSNEIQPEKRREEKSIDDAEECARVEVLTEREIVLIAMGHDKSGCTATGRMVGNQNDVLTLNKWRNDLGLSMPEIETVVIEVISRRAGKPPPNSFNFFNEPMQELAGQKKSPKLEPIEGQKNGTSRNTKPNDRQEFDKKHREFARRLDSGEINRGPDESDPFAGM